MPSPPIQLFLTTIASAPALRQRQEYLLRILQVKRIPFVSYDLASDPNAKRLWRRRAPAQEQALPGILIGGVWPGSFEQFEEAVERGELETFLRLNQDYDPEIDGKVLPSQPIGVPGAAMPLDMTGHKPSFAPGGPSPMAKSGNPGTDAEIIDAGDALPGYGLQGLKITIDELANLAKELDLKDKSASGSTKGLKLAKKAATETAAEKEPAPPKEGEGQEKLDSEAKEEATSGALKEDKKEETVDAEGSKEKEDKEVEKKDAVAEASKEKEGKEEATTAETSKPDAD